MSDLPAIGSRWGDLSEVQRAALPVGTELTRPRDQVYPRIVKVRAGGWKPKHSQHRNVWPDCTIGDSRIVACYPDPTPVQDEPPPYKMTGLTAGPGMSSVENDR